MKAREFLKEHPLRPDSEDKVAKIKEKIRVSQIVRDLESCVQCLSPLEFQYSSNYIVMEVHERCYCPVCGARGKDRRYALC